MRKAAKINKRIDIITRWNTSFNTAKRPETTTLKRGKRALNKLSTKSKFHEITCGSTISDGILNRTCCYLVTNPNTNQHIDTETNSGPNLGVSKLPFVKPKGLWPPFDVAYCCVICTFYYEIASGAEIAMADNPDPGTSLTYFPPIFIVGY